MSTNHNTETDHPFHLELSAREVDMLLEGFSLVMVKLPPCGEAAEIALALHGRILDLDRKAHGDQPAADLEIMGVVTQATVAMANAEGGPCAEVAASETARRRKEN